MRSLFNCGVRDGWNAVKSVLKGRMKVNLASSLNTVFLKMILGKGRMADIRKSNQTICSRFMVKGHAAAFCLHFSSAIGKVHYPGSFINPSVFHIRFQIYIISAGLRVLTFLSHSSIM